ncbi:MAG: guanitoxin biosynthesis MBL fold metallo-hydrolase GntH [Pirellulaceae bacterium]|nr:guanitoxin biosynthesis MBL fold metallo-hydrolase GntH [Pirellulaceae bacterium]
MQKFRTFLPYLLFLFFGIAIGVIVANEQLNWGTKSASANSEIVTNAASTYENGESERNRTVALSQPKSAPAGGVASSPTGVAPDRYVYYPGTETLKENEIRVICCGSGMPAARHGQAACCWLMECGNGDKFLFDLGTGSMANVAALMIPYQYLDKVFLSHLHTDHFGDIDALWAGGWTAGRPNALKVWGPSGATPEMGTAYAMEHFLKSCNWDYQTRAIKVGPIPGQIETTEFDYKGENQIVYDENGVTIRSWPAIHCGDGPVSFSLEYNDLKIVFGGDSVPNKWFDEYAKDADLCIHECMHTPEQLHEFYNQAPPLALAMNTDFHTSAQAFGKVMSGVEPRHAVAYHFFNEEGTRYGIYDAIRETYSGPLSLATDLMVWNVTEEGIKERMAVATHEAWSVPGDAKQPPAPTESGEPVLSQAMEDGRVNVEKTNERMVREFSKKYGIPLPKK